MEGGREEHNDFGNNQAPGYREMVRSGVLRPGHCPLLYVFFTKTTVVVIDTLEALRKAPHSFDDRSHFGGYFVSRSTSLCVIQLQLRICETKESSTPKFRDGRSLREHDRLAERDGQSLCTVREAGREID